MFARLGWSKTGKSPAAAVEEPECPSELFYLWNFFLEVLSGVSVSGTAPAVVTWTDLTAWSSLTGNRLEPWEARCLVGLGNLRASIVGQRNDRPDKNRTDQ